MFIYLQIFRICFLAILYKFDYYKLLFLQFKIYIFKLQIELDDSFTVSDNEYLWKKSESPHSSKCIEISSAPKAKKLKLER